jgi:hypothetical protein
VLQDIYNERADVSYGHAVGLPVNNNKRKRKERIVESSLDPKQKKCKCGSTEHSRITHKFCPLNKNNNTSTPEIETNCDSISVTLKQNIQNMVSTMCLLQEADVLSNSEDSDNDTYRN